VSEFSDITQALVEKVRLAGVDVDSELLQKSGTIAKNLKAGIGPVSGAGLGLGVGAMMSAKNGKLIENVLLGAGVGALLGWTLKEFMCEKKPAGKALLDSTATDIIHK
jgi:hypothetical protein